MSTLTKHFPDSFFPSNAPEDNRFEKASVAVTLANAEIELKTNSETKIDFIKTPSDI